MVKGVKKKVCCTDVLNLPEEMEVELKKLGGLDELKKRVPGREELAQEAEVFHAMSDPIRLQILHSLRDCALCPCLLIEITGLSNSKLSYHLSILEEARLIVSSPQKKWRIYMLTEEGRSRVNG